MLGSLTERITRTTIKHKRQCVISHNKLIFDSMKNSSDVMKDLRMNNKLKVFFLAMVEKFGSYSFWWLRRGS